MSLHQFFKKYVLTTKIIPFLLLVVSFSIYANCFYNEMFWDDDDFILKNQYIQHWQHWPKYFSDNVVAGNYLLSNYWRPVLLFLFSLEWHLWQDWVVGYHVVSIFIHSLASILLFFLLNRLFNNIVLSFLTSFIFLIHPIHTEAVVYPNAVSDPLGTCFLLAGLIVYMKFRAKENPMKGNIFYCLTILFYMLGIMTRETIFMMPAFLFTCDLVVFQNLPFKDKVIRSFKALVPFFIIAGIYLLLRGTVLNFKNTFNFYNEDNAFTTNYLIRLFTFFRVLSTYFGLLFFPLNLHVERTVPLATSIFSGSVIFGTSIFFGLWAWAIKSINKNPIITFGVLWFFAGLFPSSNLLIPINALLYEHFLYLACIGIFLILFHIVLGLVQKKGFESAGIILLLFYTVFFCTTTIRRNLDWKDPVTFYENLLKYAPKSYRVINNLGMEYADRGIHEKAEEIYKRAIALDPSNAVAYHNIAGTFRDTGRRDLAIEYFKHAVELDPRFIFSYRSLAQIYYEDKNYSAARTALEKTLDISPEPGILETLSQLAYFQNDLKACKTYLKRALTLDPNNKKLQKRLADVDSIK